MCRRVFVFVSGPFVTWKLEKKFMEDLRREVLGIATPTPTEPEGSDQKTWTMRTDLIAYPPRPLTDAGSAFRKQSWEMWPDIVSDPPNEGIIELWSTFGSDKTNLKRKWTH